jgi:hypothetical protein
MADAEGTRDTGEVLVRRIATILVLFGCCLGLAQAAAADPPSYADNPNPVLLPKQSHPYGADMTTWGERAAAWIVGQPFAHNPLFDQTGADCGNGQQGPVWFIPPIAGPHVFSGSRSCTIPAGKAILLDIGHDLNDYPCPPAFGFEPTPGESLYDFLIRTDLPIMDSVNLLDVSLDGQPFSDVLGYRFISPSLFYFTGDSSMQAFDPCITGTLQPAIVDGFFMMFKPLDPGQHTIVVHGTNTFGDDKTFAYHLTIA